MKKLLKCHPKSTLFYKRQYFSEATQITMQHWSLNSIQNNAAQHWWYNAILAANTISIIGKFAKMFHPDYFGEDGCRNSHHSNSEN